MKHYQVRFCLSVVAWVLAFIAIIAVQPTTALAANRDLPAPSIAPQNVYNCSYVVRYGDTLFSIAIRYNTTIYALAAINGLYNYNFIYAGMILRVPCQAPPPGGNPPPNGVCGYHIVQRGEWLSLIASRHGTTWEVLAQFNHLANPNWLYAGMRLAIPCNSDGSGQWKTFTSTAYHYTVNYPADWTAQRPLMPVDPVKNPEFVTLVPNTGGLPRVEIAAQTGTPPFTGYENCVRNFVFRGLPTCKIYLPPGQNPASDIFVFQRGNAHFRIVLAYKDASSGQVFDDIMRSFQFTQ